MEQHAEILIGKPWNQRIPRWHDIFAVLLVLGTIILLGLGGRQMVAPFTITQQPAISLSPSILPQYALRTTIRMLAALLASLIFTFTYATAAAKSRRAEMLLIPLLDVLQSVPVLGYLSFTVVFFVSLFPGTALGPELAAIFAIFTAQAWNMAFSFYQGLRTVPMDLEEASRAFRLSAWQRFWRLEVPFAMPGLIWNMMMSMSGGWFFLVASEAIAVGSIQIQLPGVGIIRCAGDRAAQPASDRLGDIGDDRHHCSLRSASFQAAGGLGRQIPFRANRGSGGAAKLVTGRVPAVALPARGGRTAWQWDGMAGAIAFCASTANALEQPAEEAPKAGRHCVAHGYCRGVGLCGMETGAICAPDADIGRPGNRGQQWRTHDFASGNSDCSRVAHLGSGGCCGGAETEAC